jgi:hypothetical protein
MTDPKDYSFLLSPGGKTRYIAGAFDYEKREPHYEIEVSIPHHVRDQVEMNQVLLGSPQKNQWGWDIHNKSSWPAFIIVKKDGILVKLS